MSNEKQRSILDAFYKQAFPVSYLEIKYLLFHSNYWHRKKTRLLKLVYVNSSINAEKTQKTC